MYNTSDPQYALVMWSTLLGDSAHVGLKVTYSQDLECLDVVLQGFERWRSRGIWQRLVGILDHPKLKKCQCEYHHRPAQKATESIVALMLFKVRLAMDMPVSGLLQHMLCSHILQFLSVSSRSAWPPHVEDIDKYCEALWAFKQRPYREGTHCDNCRHWYLSDEYQHTRNKLLNGCSYLEYHNLVELIAYSEIPLKRRNFKSGTSIPFPVLSEDEGMELDDLQEGPWPSS
jgi:hypothetical protein